MAADAGWTFEDGAVHIVAKADDDEKGKQNAPLQVESILPKSEVETPCSILCAGGGVMSIVVPDGTPVWTWWGKNLWKAVVGTESHPSKVWKKCGPPLAAPQGRRFTSFQGKEEPDDDLVAQLLGSCDPSRRIDQEYLALALHKSEKAAAHRLEAIERLQEENDDLRKQLRLAKEGPGLGDCSQRLEGSAKELG